MLIPVCWGLIWASSPAPEQLTAFKTSWTVLAPERSML